MPLSRGHRVGAVLAVAVTVVTFVASGGRAQAFCGFFVAGSDAKLTNNASQVVLMRKGNRTVMTMSEQLQGTARELRDGGAGAGRAAEGGRQDAARRRVRPASTRCRRRAWSSTGSRTRARRAHARRRWPMRWRRRRRRRRRRPGGSARDLRRQDRGAVRRRRVRDRHPVGEGLAGPRDLAAPGEVQHPAGRGGGAGARTCATSRSSSSPRSTSRR